MATGGLRRDMSAEAEKNKLMCSVCLEPYRQPKLLPCFHTFCTPCLQQLATSTTSGPVQAGDNSQFVVRPGTTVKAHNSHVATGGDNSSFACPTCRRVVVVPPRGVEEFQRNFKMEAALASAASESLTCEMCDNSSTATIACVECQKRLCAPCQRVHDQVAGTKYHNLISLESSGNQATAGPTRAAPQKFCKTHNRQELVFLCCSCDVTICSQCLQSPHKGHQTEDLAVASERIMAEVRELLGKLEVKVKATKEVIAGVNKTEQDLERQRQGVINEAVEAAGKVAAWANQAEDNLVKEVDKMAAPLKAQLQSQKTAAREDNAALVQIQDRAKLVMKNGTYAELQSLRSDIERSLASEASSLSLQDVVGQVMEDKFFKRLSSGQEVLQNVVPKFVGAVQPSKDDGEESRTTAFCISKMSWTSQEYFSVCPDLNGKRFAVLSKNDEDISLTKFDTEGEEISSLTLLHDYYGQAPCLHLLRSSAYLVCTTEFQLITVSDKGQMKSVDNTSNLVLAHSAPNGNMYAIGRCGEEDVFEIQKITVDAVGQASSKPVLQVVLNNLAEPEGFDVSAVENYFAVARVIDDTYPECAYAEVVLFKRMQPEPCAVFKSPITPTCERLSSFRADVCFSMYTGKEMLRLAVRDKNCIYVLDHTNGCAVVNRMGISGPVRLAKDEKERVWVASDGGFITIFTT